MGKNMCEFWSQPPHIQHPYEDEVHGNFRFLFLFLRLVDFFINIYFSNAHLLYLQRDFFRHSL
jgi:hypothetical protein